MWIVLPLIVAYIGYQIATFPEKLGNKVSKKIRVELEQNFESTNKTMLQKIFDTVFGGNELVEIIAKDEEFQTMLKTLEKKLRLDEEPAKQPEASVIEIKTDDPPPYSAYSIDYDDTAADATESNEYVCSYCFRNLLSVGSIARISG